MKISIGINHLSKFIYKKKGNWMIELEKGKESSYVFINPKKSKNTNILFSLISTVMIRNRFASKSFINAFYMIILWKYLLHMSTHLSQKDGFIKMSHMLLGGKDKINFSSHSFHSIFFYTQSISYGVTYLCFCRL